MGESKPTHSEACCEYCGRPLAPCVVEFGARRIVAGFRECDCEGARGQRARADYLESFEGSAGRGLYIYGSVGRGKSYSAAALANAFVDAGYRTVFTTASAMLERIKASFSGNGETDSVISRYAACDVLVLDDLGKEDAKEWSSNMMFLVINARYENMRPTIFTSNYSPQALSKRLGRKGETETAEAIASRLSETTIPIHLTGPDMRIASRM